MSRWCFNHTVPPGQTGEGRRVWDDGEWGMLTIEFGTDTTRSPRRRTQDWRTGLRRRVKTPHTYSAPPTHEPGEGRRARSLGVDRGRWGLSLLPILKRPFRQTPIINDGRRMQSALCNSLRLALKNCTTAGRLSFPILNAGNGLIVFECRLIADNISPYCLIILSFEEQFC